MKTLSIAAILLCLGTVYASGWEQQQRRAYASQCSALERLGRWAQAKLNSGYQPSEAQRASADRKIAWYNSYCH